MKKFVSAVALALVAAMLAACGGSGDGGGSGSGSKANDSITFWWPAPPAGWDPAQSNSMYIDQVFMWPVYDRLVRLTAQGTVEPMLATEWEFSPDFKTITMTLRDDVTFEDGSKFDADVAVKNLESRIAEGSKVATYLTGLDSVEAVDPTHLQINLSAPDPDFLFKLEPPSASMISAASIGTPGLATSSKGAGSGPYRVVSQTADRVVYEANPDYWDTSFEPIKNLTIVGNPDDNARVNAMRTGQADVVQLKSFQLDQAKDLEESGHQLVNYSDTSHLLFVVFLNSALKPFDDPRVRQALNLGMDRKELVDAGFGGEEGCPIAGQLFGDNDDGHVDDLEDYPVDVDQAKALLKEAGQENLTFDMIQSTNAPADTLSQVFQEQMKRIGVTVNLVKTDAPQATPNWLAGQTPAYLWSTQSPTPDSLSTIELGWLGAYNAGGKNPDYDGGKLADLVAEAKLNPTGSDERIAKKQEIAEYLYDEPLHLPICHYSVMFSANKDMTGLEELPYANQGFSVDVTRLNYK